MSFLRAFATVSGLTLVSRIAGFTRDLLTAALLGAGPIADAFFVALKLPNFLRRFFAEGAFGVSFIPIYAGKLEAEGEAAATGFAEGALALLLLALIPLTALAMAFMPQLVLLLAPGFADDPQRFAPAVELGRITFPYLLMISVVALFGGVLNAHNRFAPFAAAPIAFNLSLITCLLALGNVLPSGGHALALGVAVAGIVQLIWLAWEVTRLRVRLHLRWPRLDADQRKLLKIMGPAALGAGVVQLNLLIDLILASLLPTGAVAYLYYADRLNQMPIGLIGVAIGTALLPMLAKTLEVSDREGSDRLYSRAVDFGLLLALPAAAALIAIPEALVAGLFQRGAFDAEDTAATALTLAAYGVGVPAFILAKIGSTAHFARKDTKTPVKIGILSALSNIVLSLALIGPFAQAGIALATAMAAWLQAMLLVLAIRRKGWLSLDRQAQGRLPRIVLASGLMGLALFAGGALLGPPLSDSAGGRIALVALLVACGGGVYAALIFGLRVLRPAEIKRLVSRRAVRET